MFSQRKLRNKISELRTAQLPQQDITYINNITSLQHHVTLTRQCLPDMTSILHYMTLHYTTLHCIALRYVTLRYITLHLHCIIINNYITLHYIALHCIALHYTTLHYITAQYISSTNNSLLRQNSTSSTHYLNNSLR